MARILQSDEHQGGFLVKLDRLMERYSGLQQPPSCQESEMACIKHMALQTELSEDFKSFIKELKEQFL